MTYHLSGDEWVQLEYLNKKTPFNFIPGGTTQNQFTASVVKRFGRELEMNAWVQYEGWKAPIYKPGLQKRYFGRGGFDVVSEAAQLPESALAIASATAGEELGRIDI